MYWKQWMFEGCESYQCGWRDDNLEDPKEEEDVAEVVVETVVRIGGIPCSVRLEI